MLYTFVSILVDDRVARDVLATEISEKRKEKHIAYRSLLIFIKWNSEIDISHDLNTIRSERHHVYHSSPPEP